MSYDEHVPHSDYNLIDQFKETDDSKGKWLHCPVCYLRPKVWTFDNGSHTGCGCGNNMYHHRDIHDDGPMAYARRNGMSFNGYDSDAHRKQWNTWVESVPKQPVPGWVI